MERYTYNATSSADASFIQAVQRSETVGRQD